MLKTASFIPGGLGKRLGNIFLFYFSKKLSGRETYEMFFDVHKS